MSDLSNNKMPKFEDYERLTRQLAGKAHRRLKAAGVTTQFEDVYQEVSVSFVMASRAFKPESNNKFSTYFVRSVWNNINKFVDAEVRNRRLGDLSIDEEQVEGKSLQEVIPNADRTPEQIVIGKSHQHRVFKLVDELDKIVCVHTS